MTENTELIELLGRAHVQWRINDFKRLPAIVDDSFESPRFRMSDANWFLQICPCGETRVDSCGWIGLYLWKEKSTTEFRVAFSLQIIRTDGSVLKSYDMEDTFEKEKYAWGESEVIERSSLLSSKDALTLDGTLTVVCSARIIDRSALSSLNEDETHTSSPAITTTESASQTTCGISTLIQNFQDLCIKKLGADVTITVKGREFLAHSSVLSARSTVFCCMFNNDMAEKHSGKVEISDCDPDSFEDFLLFLYTGQLEVVSSSNAASLYMYSDKYYLKELKEECVRCMVSGLTVDSICDVLQIAVIHNETDLLVASTNFFLQNAKNVLLTLKWQHFSAENPSLGNELFLKYVTKYTKE